MDTALKLLRGSLQNLPKKGWKKEEVAKHASSRKLAQISLISLSAPVQDKVKRARESEVAKKMK